MLLDMAADGGPALKMVVSYGGQITRCSDTGKARYAGGENRIVRVGMSERLSELRARLAAMAGYSDVRIRYAVAGPGGDALDTLHDVADEHGLWVLVTRICCCNGLAARDGRVRAFLFPVNAPPRPTHDGIGILRPASSPSLLESSKQGNGVVAGGTTLTTLQKAQSAMELSSWTTPASTVALSSDHEGSATQADSGFEALAEIAAAQRSASATGNPAASSSETPSSSGVVASSSTTGQADDSGFEALAAIAAAQSSATENTATGATTCCVAQADSGFEALATVAAVAGQVLHRPAAAAAVFFVVPVAPVAVFFHAIPGNGCLIPAVL